MSNHTTLTTIFAAMRREALCRDAGDVEGAEAAYGEAEDALQRALDEANAEGREQLLEEQAERGGRDPAEDYEPDVSDVGFDPYMGQYTDDC